MVSLKFPFSIYKCLPPPKGPSNPKVLRPLTSSLCETGLSLDNGGRFLYLSYFIISKCWNWKPFLYTQKYPTFNYLFKIISTFFERFTSSPYPFQLLYLTLIRILILHHFISAPSL